MIFQSIRTKYHGPTDYRGSRITATASGGCKATISYPYELDTAAGHKRAAETLCAKLGWPVKRLHQGESVGGYVFVFANEA